MMPDPNAPTGFLRKFNKKGGAQKPDPRDLPDSNQEGGKGRGLLARMYNKKKGLKP